MTAPMTSNKPYLIRAYYDWIVDNGFTPYLAVKADYPGIDIPQEYAVDGKIVLNISPQACRGLHMENDKIIFTTKFSGRAVQVCVTPASVLAVYAKENGEGIQFPETSIEPPPPSNYKKVIKKPSLKLVE